MSEQYFSSLFCTRNFVAAFWIIAIFDIVYLTPFLGTGVKLNAPPTVGVSASLLFALPGIRNAMPGSPPVGRSVHVGRALLYALSLICLMYIDVAPLVTLSVLDFASYFWALLIAILCFAYAVSRWSVDVHPPPPAPKPAEKKE